MYDIELKRLKGTNNNCLELCISFKLDKPFVVRFTLSLFNNRGHGKFSDMHAFFFSRFDQAVFHFLSYHMLAEGGNKMLGTARYHHPVRIDGQEFYGIPDQISPGP